MYLYLVTNQYSKKYAPPVDPTASSVYGEYATKGNRFASADPAAQMKLAKALIREQTGRANVDHSWEYYGGHHLENRMTAFCHGVYLPEEFGSDMRNNTLAAMARNGQLSREEARLKYNSERLVERNLVSYFKKRLEISDDQYDHIMNAEPRSWVDFPTYKKRFERFRPLFYLLARSNLVPMSFYLKYCFARD